MNLISSNMPQIMGKNLEEIFTLEELANFSVFESTSIPHLL
jgi:hypothetical protein